MSLARPLENLGGGETGNLEFSHSLLSCRPPCLDWISGLNTELNLFAHLTQAGPTDPTGRTIGFWILILECWDFACDLSILTVGHYVGLTWDSTSNAADSLTGMWIQKGATPLRPGRMRDSLGYELKTLYGLVELLFCVQRIVMRHGFYSEVW